jgi:hypothetical protein
VETAIAEMQALVGRLRIKDAPSGAKLTINGKPRGSAPFSKPFILDPGLHTIEVSLDGHETLNTDVTIASGAEVSIRAALKAAQTSVLIDCSEPEGIVFIDGTKVGGCPFEGEVSPGNHQIGVKAPDKKTFIYQINVIAGAQAVVPVKMIAYAPVQAVEPKPQESAPPPPTPPPSLRVAWPRLNNLVKNPNIPKQERIDEIDSFLETYRVGGKIQKKVKGWKTSLESDMEPESYDDPRYMATHIEAISLRGYGGSYGGGAMLGFATGRWPWFYLGGRVAGGGGIEDEYDSTRWWISLGLHLGVPIRIGRANHHEFRVGTGLLVGFLRTYFGEDEIEHARWSFGLILAPEVYYVWHIAKKFSLHVGWDMYIGVLSPDDTEGIGDLDDNADTERAAPVINGFLGFGI